jgi:predicted PurR-regulated permease PerM
MTYLLNPLVVTFERRGAPRGFSIIIIYALLIILALMTFGILIPKITRELVQLTNVLPEQTRRIETFINQTYDRYSRYDIPQPIRGVVEDTVDRFEGRLLKLARDAVQSVLGFIANIFNFIIAPIIAFFLTKDLDSIKTKFRDLLPAQYRNDIIQVLIEADAVLGGYIRGQLMISGVILVLVTVSLTLMGVNFSLILGFVAGLTNIIPYFGPFIGAAPAISVALLSSPLKALYVAILFLVVHQLESTIISPRILGENVGLHPLAVIVAINIFQTLPTMTFSTATKGTPMINPIVPNRDWDKRRAIRGVLFR